MIATFASPSRANYLIVHVLDKQNSKKSQVEVKVPMKVIDALFSPARMN